MADIVISAYALRHLMMCERRVWLDEYGDIAVRDELPQMRSEQGIAHEQVVASTMFGPATPVPVNSWGDMLQTTHDLMWQGVSGIQGAAFERTIQLAQPVTVRGRVDWLRRVSQPSQFGKWSYEPIEIKLRRDLLEADELQLDLYIWLLQHVQSVEPSGWFWLGKDHDNQPLHIIEHTYREERLFAVLERIGSILEMPNAPAIFLAAHCETCHWHTTCKQKATASQDLAALPGLSRQTWEHMRREGIHTVEHVLALSPTQLQRFKGLGKSKAADLHTYAQALTQNRPVQHNLLPEAARQSGIMFDLETCMDGDIGVPWCFGWQGMDGQFHAAIVDAYFEADKLHLPDETEIAMISSSDDGWRIMAQIAQENPGPIYHWGSFEKGVLHSTAPADVIDALDDRLHDLNKTFKRTFAFPVRGTSIKTVAPYLGFRWPEGTNAFSAWADYQAWLLDSDQARLGRACAYNRADVEAMALVWRWMIDHAKGDL